MFSIIGVVCHTCKKHVSDTSFVKDRDGDPLYFTNPQLSELTDEVHYFCGAVCSAAWHKEQMEARKDVTR